MNHAVTTLPAIPHRTALAFRAAPVPMTDPVMAWVVEIGIPIALAPKTTKEPAVLAQNPVWWFSLVNLVPMVLMIFQPPDIVPRAMAA